MKDSKIVFRYPNFARKALTFTIDDGNVAMDEKFINIVKPNGIRGTFNLNSNNVSKFTPEGYREFYKGFEIANHCKYHPFAFDDAKEYTIGTEPFDREKSDHEKIYKNVDNEGMYFIMMPRGWRQIAETDAYIRFADEGKAELEEIFGKGSVRTYVWPFHEQNNKKILDHIKNGTYQSVRKTGNVGNSTGFAIPQDRMSWSYNANHDTLLACAKQYAEYPDDGELKFFAVGVHSVDFENANKWDDLKEWAETYGNRPEEYWSVPLCEVLDYEDATRAAKITENTITNNSDLTLYIEVNGEKKTVDKGETLTF